MQTILSRAVRPAILSVFISIVMLCAPALASAVAVPSATTLTVAPVSGVYGGTVTLSATLTKSSDSSFISGKTIIFTENNIPVGTASTNGSGVATLNNVPTLNTSAGTHTNFIKALYLGGGGYVGDNGAADLTLSQKTLTVTGITAQSKTYDGTTFATIDVSGAHRSGVVLLDVVNLVTTNATGTFDTANPGLGKTVQISGLSITGSAAANYSLVQPTTTADINVACDVANSTFDGFSNGSVDGQGGWAGTAGGPIGLSYDQKIVTNTMYPTFGCKSLRISNAVTSGTFGDWIFSPSSTHEAGESDAVNSGLSGGTRQNHFEAQFDIGAATTSFQPGAMLAVSPDRGDGSRMSFLRFEDREDGIHVFFNDYQHNAFVETEIAGGAATTTALNRSVPHTIKFSMDFVDGPSNDVVKVYIDNVLAHTGTSWEDYFRDNQPAIAPPTVDSLLFREGGSVTAAPEVLGGGFLIDNLSVTTSTIPGTLEIKKYDCPAGTSVTRSANGVGLPVPAGCVPKVGATFGYVHGTQFDANGPYPELGATLTPAGVTDSNGVISDTVPATGRYLVVETGADNQQLPANAVLGLYCIGDGDTSNNNDNQELTFVHPGETVHCVAYDQMVLPAPTPVSPADGTHITTANQTLIDWNDVSDSALPITYVYQASNSSDTNPDGSFVTPAYTSGPLSESQIPTPGTGAGTYYWHVQAHDASGDVSPWSVTRQIIVDNSVPTATFVFPVAGPSATSFHVVFNEPVVESEATDPANYFLQNWPGNGPITSLSGNASVAYDGPTHTATVTFTNTAWYVSPEQKWGVTNIHDLEGLVIDSNPTTAYSSPLVAPTAPGAPTTATPTTSTTQDWIWTASTDPTDSTNASGVASYSYSVTDDSNSNAVVVASTTVDASVLGATTNFPVGSYTFHVNAVDNAGNVSTESTGTLTVTSPVSPTPATYTVTIDKFIDGVMATAGTANNASFPMTATWNNLGADAGTGTYALAPTGFNSPNAYEAVTENMNSGSSYSTSEVTDGEVVGTSCESGDPYALVGYKVGSSLAGAEASNMTTDTPSFTNLSQNEVVIVLNQTCNPVPVATVTTDDATSVAAFDATLNGHIGGTAAQGHSFWVSTTTIDTSSPTIPTGVYSTPDMLSIDANMDFSASLSSVTNEGIPANLPAITANTTYYYVAWANVGGTWVPGEVKHFTTSNTPPALPAAVAQTLTTTNGAPVAVTLTGTGGVAPLSYIQDSSPTFGSLSGTLPNLTYTPSPFHFGTDSFTFKVTDGTNTSADATVSITNNDTIAPTITLTAPNPTSVVAGSTYVDPGVVVTDNSTESNLGYSWSVDGGATSTDETAITVDTTSAGTHTIFFTAQDSSHNVANASRVVTVTAPLKAPIPLVLSLGGNGPISGSLTNSGGDGGNGGGSNGGGGDSGGHTGPLPSGNGQVAGASTYNFQKNFGIGSRISPDVTELQKILIADGYLKIIAPTGYFGPSTMAAVKLYQKANNISATGFVGILTRAVLNLGTTPAAH